jgi:hypothetical protein
MSRTQRPTQGKDIRNTVLAIRDLLLPLVERGTTPNIVRAYVLTESVLEQFFSSADDQAGLPAEEHVYLALRPEDTVCGKPLPPA